MRRAFQQFFSLLTILSFSLTQVAPVWAQTQTLRGSIEGIQSGLEEVVLDSNAANTYLVGAGFGDSGLVLDDFPDSRHPLAAVSPHDLHNMGGNPDWAVPSPEVQRLIQRLVPYAEDYPTLGTRDQNVPDFIRYMFDELRKQEGLPFAVPAADRVEGLLSRLEENRPRPDCACWLRAQINHWGNDERNQPEAAQSESFNAWEQLLGLGLVAEWLLNGEVKTQDGAGDGHLTPVISLSAVQVASNAVMGPVAAYSPWLARGGMDLNQMRQALEAGHGVLARVGEGHLINITEVTATHVVYQDAISQDRVQRKLHADFSSWWNQGSQTGVALTTAPPATQNDLLGLDQAQALPCACGAYLNGVRAGGMAATLLALLKLEYRGQDNAGLLLKHHAGASRLLSYGPAAVRNLMRRIYRGEFEEIQEERSFDADQTLISRNLRQQRRSILGRQNLGRDLVDQSGHNREALSVDRLFVIGPDGEVIPEQDRVTLGRGDYGSVYAGAQFEVDDAMEVIADISDRYKVLPAFAKMFVRFELEKILEDNPDHLLARAFDQLVDRAIAGTLNNNIQIRVGEGRMMGEADAWSLILETFQSVRAKKPVMVTVPPLFSRDMVGQAFQMQGAIIGTFSQHVNWRNEVQEIFNRRVRLRTAMNGRKSAPALDWNQQWQAERAANMAGLAFEAFNEWQRMHFFRMDRIHEDTFEREGDSAAYASISGRATDLSDAPLDEYDRVDQHLGRFNPTLSELLGDGSVGHGRWAMSGGVNTEVRGPEGGFWLSPAPAHPHGDPNGTRFVAHNGQIDADTHSEIFAEHQDAGVSYVELDVEITTDTKEIPNHWHHIAKLFDEYYDEWRESDSVRGFSDATGISLALAEKYDERFKLWNQIAVSQLQAQGFQSDATAGFFSGKDTWIDIVDRVEAAGGVAPWHDELAHRVSSIELSQGETQMGTTAYSAHDPFTQRGVDHKRGIKIAHRNGAFIAASDEIAALSLFEPERLVEASRAIQEVKDRTYDQIFGTLRSRVRDNPQPGTDEITELEFYKQALVIYREAEAEIAQIEEPFTLEVTDLKGEGNYYKIWKVIDENGIPQVRIEVTTLYGELKPVAPKQKRISPSVADKGQYNTFTEAHFHAVPWIVLKEILQYMSIEKANSMDEILPDLGLPPGELRTAGATPGLYWDVLAGNFGGETMPEMERLSLVGVGSALQNVRIAGTLANEVLPPQVTVSVFDTGAFAAIASEGYVTADTHDAVIANSQSGTTASTLNTQEYFVHAGATAMAITANMRATLGQVAMQTAEERSAEGIDGTVDGAGAVDALGGHEISVATYMNFVAQNVALFLQILAQARHQGTPMDVLTPYHRDMLRLPGLLKEITDSEEYQITAQAAAEANQHHNKVLAIGSDRTALMKELGIKEEEGTWRASHPFDYQDDYEPMLMEAAREGRTTVWIWATDPDRLDEAYEAIQFAVSLGLKPIVVTLREENPRLEEIRSLDTFRYEVPKVHGVIQTIVDNPIIMHQLIAFVKVIGRTDEEIDFLRNLAKSVVVFSFDWKAKKWRMSMADFGTQWAQVVRDLGAGANPWQTYAAWAGPMRSVAGLEEVAPPETAAADQLPSPESMSPQERALAQVPLVASDLIDEYLPQGSQFGVDFRKRLATKFGRNLSKLKRVVIVADQEPLRYAAEELKLDLPRTLGMQATDVHVVRSTEQVTVDYLDARKRYIDPESTLVIVLSQSERNFSDRRIFPWDETVDQLPYKREDSRLKLAGDLRNSGVAVLTISDKNSRLASVGSVSLGAMVLPEDTTDTAAKLAFSVALDTVTVQMGRTMFDQGRRRTEVDAIAKNLRGLPAFLAHHTVMNPKFLDDVRSAGAAISLHDKSLWMGGEEAEASAKEGGRFLRMNATFSKGEPAHSGTHGPLANVRPDKRKWRQLAGGGREVDPEADVDDDTAWVIVGNGNQVMSSDDIRVVETREGVVVVIANENLAENLASAAKKNLGALRVVRIPDAPLIFIKHINHMANSYLALEIARHHRIRSRMNSGLADSWRPHTGVLMEMAVESPGSTLPAQMRVTTPGREGSGTDLLFFSEYGPELLAIAETVLEAQGIPFRSAYNFVEGIGGVGYLRVEATPQRIENLREQIMHRMSLRQQELDEVPSENNMGPITVLTATDDVGYAIGNLGIFAKPMIAAASIANTHLASGAVGAVSTGGAVTLAQMGSPEAEGSPLWNLNQLAVLARTVHSTHAVERAASVMGIDLTPVGDEPSRLAQLHFSRNRQVSVIAWEGVKRGLTNNLGRPLAPGETGSGISMVISIGEDEDRNEAAGWVLPPFFERGDEEQAYAAQVVGYLPPGQLDNLEKETDQVRLRALLNPLPPVAESPGQSSLEQQLEEWARLNNIPNHVEGPYQDRPDLSYILIRGLQRERHQVYENELSRLASERGLQWDPYEDGTLVDGLAATMPPRDPGTGFTPKDPLQISFTTTWATEATYIGRSIGGGALHRGAVSGIRFLPRTIEAGTRENPIANATNWSEGARQAFRDWRGDAQGNALAEGRHLIHSDFTGRTAFLFVPTTDIGVDLNLRQPIQGTLGIPGASRNEEERTLNYTALVAYRGVVFVQELSSPAITQERTTLISPFDPSTEYHIRPDAERTAFNRASEIQTEDWARGRNLAPEGLAILRRSLQGLFAEFRNSGNPQIGVLPYPDARERTPSRKPEVERSVLLAVAPDRPYLDDDLKRAPRAQGGNFRQRNETFRGDVSIVVMGVDNVSVRDLQAMEPEIQARLIFTDRMLQAVGDPTHVSTLPEEVQVAFDTYRSLIREAAPAVTSLIDPSSDSRTLIYMTFPDAPEFASALEVVRAAFRGTQPDQVVVVAGDAPTVQFRTPVSGVISSPVTAPSATTWIFSTSTPADHERLLAGVTRVENALRGLAGLEPLASDVSVADALNQLMERMGGRSSEEVQWYREMYTRFSEDGLPAIGTRISGEHPDDLIIAGIIPFDSQEELHPELYSIVINFALDHTLGSVEVSRSWVMDTAAQPGALAQGPRAALFHIAVDIELIPDQLREPLRDAIREGLSRFMPAGGLEELTPDLGADALTDTSQPAVVAATQAFLNQPGVATAGPLTLSQTTATRLLGRPARGGILAPAGSITGLEELDGIVVGDTQVINQVNPALKNLAAFIPLGDDWNQVRAALGGISANDLVFLEASDPNLTPAAVEATLTNLFGTGPSARAVLTQPREVQLLSAAALTQVWSSNTLPKVVTLGVALQLRDRQGQLFNLVIWV